MYFRRFYRNMTDNQNSDQKSEFRIFFVDITCAFCVENKIIGFFSHMNPPKSEHIVRNLYDFIIYWK